MTERLGKPDTARFPPLAPTHVCVLAAGVPLGRIYSAGGDYPTTWNAFRSYGPTTSRFDHQPLPSRVHPRRRIIYVAATVPDRYGRVQPLLRTCMAEVYRDRQVVELRRDDPYFAMFAPARELRLLDLSDSDWVTVAGGNGAITSGARHQARNWARAIYRHYTDEALDGIIYAPSNLAPARSLALWERAETAIPDRPLFNEPLRHIGLRARVEQYAASLVLPVVDQ